MNARFVVLAFVAGLLIGPAAAQAPAGKSPPLALKGHDPVAYFTEGRPMRGAASINVDFDESRYLFASAKNRELFSKSPDRYTPQFAGLCATGMAFGKSVDADPSIFVVRDGKLYIFSSAEARDMAQKDPSLLGKSHQAWKAPK